MPDQTTRQLAEKVMRSAIADIDLPAVHRALHEAADASTTVPGVGVGAVRVAEAIRTAVVTVTWPEDGSHVVTREALIDAISRIELRRIKPEGGVILVAAETLADAILAVVEETS